MGKALLSGELGRGGHQHRGRTANKAGESEAEHGLASIRMQGGFSQQLLCCRAMPQ